MNYVEIKMTKARLFLTEDELLSLLRTNPGLWEIGLRRGKVILRARAREKRPPRPASGKVY